jgi:anti-sigma B factor antagonist
MMVKVTTRDRDNVTILDVAGTSATRQVFSALRDRIWELVRAGSNRILINMAGINDIDSLGMGELVGAYITVTNAGGEMKLLNVSSWVRRLLDLTRLSAVFETHDDEEFAVRSFSRTRTFAGFESRSEIFFG